MREDTAGEGSRSTTPTWEALEGFVRERAQELIQQNLEQEVTELLRRGKSERKVAVDGPEGYRNGYGKPRHLVTSIGSITVQRPRVRGLQERFESRVLPLFARRTKEVGALLPGLYLHGLAEGDFELAMRGLLGEAAPLSKATMRRLREGWVQDFEAQARRSLTDREVVQIWADGIYVKAGLEKDKAALLVVIGAMRDGTKEVLAIVPGYRKSTESWAVVLRDLKARGLGDPRLLMADGNPAIWAAARQVWPLAADQRCSNHKIRTSWPDGRSGSRSRRGNYSQRSSTPPIRAAALEAGQALRRRLGPWYPKAVATLEEDWDRMVTFYDFPEEHWKHLRTTKVVESPFASVRLRATAAKRLNRVERATALIWKLPMVAGERFRKLDAPNLLRYVYDSRKFENGRPVSPSSGRPALKTTTPLLTRPQFDSSCLQLSALAHIPSADRGSPWVTPSPSPSWPSPGH